jgi:hypothetical protein
LKAVIVLCAVASGCGGAGDCDDARNAAGKAVAAAWPGLDEARSNAEQALAAALRRREDRRRFRLDWGNGLRTVQATMGCIEGKAPERCCDRMRAWLQKHRKPPVTTGTTAYFPSLVIQARELRRIPGREEEGEEVVKAIEAIQDLMAEDSGEAHVLDQVAGQCETTRQLLERLVASADAVAPQPEAERAELDARATAARTAHDWLVALATGAAAASPANPPPALREPAAAVARYMAACHD